MFDIHHWLLTKANIVIFDVDYFRIYLLSVLAKHLLYKIAQTVDMSPALFASPRMDEAVELLFVFVCNGQIIRVKLNWFAYVDMSANREFSSNYWYE